MRNALILLVVLVLGFAVVASTASGQTRATVQLNTTDTAMLQLASFGSDLTVGSRGPAVETLERYLQSKGYLPALVVPDQVFDGVTEQALAGYQAQAHVLNTGYFGPHTRAHIHMILILKMLGYPLVVQ